MNLRGPGPSGSSEPYSIYVSLDHQSNPDDLFPLRSHVYSGGVWVRHIGAHSSSRPRKLRFILPYRIGHVVIRNDVPESLVREAIEVLR